MGKSDEPFLKEPFATEYTEITERYKVADKLDVKLDGSEV